MSADEAMFRDSAWVYAVDGAALYIGKRATWPPYYSSISPGVTITETEAGTTLSPCYIRTFALIPTTTGQLTTIAAFQPAHVAHGMKHDLPIVLNVPVRPVKTLDVEDQRAIASEIERADMMSSAAKSGVVLAGK